ncbi:MAG: hypothetical protein AAF529_11595 [Pseudomonadota bacterium]
MHGYAYRFLDDGLFDFVPPWYLEKVGARLPIAADLARLKWIESVLHTEDYDLVVWLDADTLIIEPDLLCLNVDEQHQFGLEFWLQRQDSKVRVYRNVHNAYCAFRPGDPLLPFLSFAVEHLVRQVDPEHLAPQFVGPKLLTSLHNMLKLNTDARFGAISPLQTQAIIAGDQALLGQLAASAAAPLMAANLCSSLISPDQAMALIDHLRPE